jgi:uncharacterized protein YjbI with pentapeptide repeats
VEQSQLTINASCDTNGCGVRMSDGHPCSRPLHAASTKFDPKPVCIMHSHDPKKPQDEFDAEIKAIFSGESEHHKAEDSFNFTKFVFPSCHVFNFNRFHRNVDFTFATFSQDALFANAQFTEGANFTGVQFAKVANFRGAKFCRLGNFGQATFLKVANFGATMFCQNANFGEARFRKGAEFRDAKFIASGGFSRVRFNADANFSRVIFNLEANFSNAIFEKEADFSDVKIEPYDRSVESLAVADFSNVVFLLDGKVRFNRINDQANSGLRARFVNCNMVGVQFDAVNWYRQNGRIVLQDELDLIEQHHKAPSYELVAIAYRRLITNFEKARAYDLVEDCTIGEFELKRRDPDRFLFTEWLKPVYKCFPLLRTWIGEQVSIVGIYRLSSLYGTSYQRAMVVLGLLLLVFGLCFSTIVDIRPSESGENRISTCGDSNVFQGLCRGLFHAFEVATLQRTPLYNPVSAVGRIIEIFEQVLVAGQAALLLFAIRRRFRR